jgi:hypothetical protein
MTKDEIALQLTLRCLKAGNLSDVYAGISDEFTDDSRLETLGKYAAGLFNAVYSSLLLEAPIGG